MNHQALVHHIISLQANAIIAWKTSDVMIDQSDFLKLVQENHAFNYQLWHAEDRARRDDKGFEYVYDAKREIDHCNQQRNNRMEAMDIWLFNQLKPAHHKECAVHSETPGMMIDRLSILALKAYHMKLQTERTDVDEEHQQNCLKKLLVIEEQLDQLQKCLRLLLDEVDAKTRTYRVYHQFKMYNDPALNPELYQKS
jgi:hypothetical protein